MDVSARVRDYISRAIVEEIADDDDIFSLGLVDSSFGMQLVLFIENEFSITLEHQDLDIKNFCSIAALTNLVQGKLDGTGEPEAGNGHPTDR